MSSDFEVNSCFEDALEKFKAENPNCKIEVFSGDSQQINDGLGLKDYPKPIDRSYPQYLIKVGREEHMIPLLKQGVVYMNPLSYFKELEDKGDGRADSGEGAHSVAQTGGIIIGGLSINQKTTITITSPTENHGYIFCMVGVYKGEKIEDVLTEKMFEMGSVAIIIYNPEQFIKRCDAVLKANNKSLEWGRVRYYDKSEGSFLLNPWLKTKDYEYQSEFRLFVPMKETKAKVLQIGSIEDIAQAFSISTKKKT